MKLVVDMSVAHIWEMGGGGGGLNPQSDLAENEYITGGFRILRLFYFPRIKQTAIGC